MKTNKAPGIIVATILVLTATSCKEDKDERLVAMAERHEQRQVEQNKQTTKLHREVTEMQREVQAERAVIGQQRDQLESERRSLAADRRYDSLVSAAITTAGLLLACLLPLVIAWYVLRQPGITKEDQAIVNLLLEDLVADQPILLNRGPDSDQTVPRLTGESSSNDAAVQYESLLSSRRNTCHT